MKKILQLILLLSLINSFSQGKFDAWEINNLSINNSYSNFGASFYGKDKIVFSSSNGNRLHLYSGIIEGNDVINQEMFLEAETHETNVAFTKNLQTMYFTRSIYGTENTKNTKKDKKNSIAIFRATRMADDKWGNIVSLPFNNKKYDVGHPTLSSDNSKLYFSSNMKGTLGETDIFVVDILGDNTYSKPRNLGDKVNTKGNELHPYIDENDVLYFSSNGHNSCFGGLDIYAYEINNKKLIHLKPPINSVFDDFSYIYNSKINIGFFSSNRQEGKGKDDIYLFRELKNDKFVVEADTDCNQRLMGTIYKNGTQKLITNAVVILKSGDDSTIDIFKTEENSKFDFKVKCNKTYKIEVTKTNYKTVKKILKTTNQKSIIARKNIFLKSSLKKASPKKRIRTGRVNFNYNEVVLLRRYTYDLDKAIILMKKEPNLFFEFESHTDSRAEDEFNMDLTRQRVEKITEYMGFKGIHISRIRGTAFGETRPINRCINGVDCYEEEYLANRRTTFVLKEKKEK